jgi:hypothetical protein
MIDTLSPKHKIHYTNYMKFLIGKDVALANSTPGKMEWSFIKEMNNIALLGNYIKLGGQMTEYIDRRVAEYLNRKKETLARNAGFLKYYSGSMQTQMVTQRLISDRMQEKRGFLGIGKSKTEEVDKV